MKAGVRRIVGLGGGGTINGLGRGNEKMIMYSRGWAFMQED